MDSKFSRIEDALAKSLRASDASRYLRRLRAWHAWLTFPTAAQRRSILRSLNEDYCVAIFKNLLPSLLLTQKTRQRGVGLDQYHAHAILVQGFLPMRFA